MRRALQVIFVLFLALLAAACIPKTRLNKAVLKLESDWKAENDRFLESEGRRFYRATKQQGFAAAQLAAARLGMVVEKQAYDTGFIFVTSPAPVPLTMQEWTVVQETDTKQMRSIVAKEVGIFSWWVTLDPSGKDVLSNIFIKETEGGIDISIGLRLRFRSATTDKLRRMQPPPSAVRIGVIPKETPKAELTVMTAASRNQVASWDKNAQHGLFTHHLIQGLSGAADEDRYGKADRRVTLEEIRGYLDREMTYAARRHYGRDQQAMVYGDPASIIVNLAR